MNKIQFYIVSTILWTDSFYISANFFTACEPTLPQSEKQTDKITNVNDHSKCQGLLTMVYGHMHLVLRTKPSINTDPNFDFNQRIKTNKD